MTLPLRDLDPSDRTLIKRAAEAVREADPGTRNWAHHLYESDPLEQTWPSSVRRVAYFQAALLLRATTSPIPTIKDVHPVADEIEEIHLQAEEITHRKSREAIADAVA